MYVHMGWDLVGAIHESPPEGFGFTSISQIFRFTRENGSRLACAAVIQRKRGWKAGLGMTFSPEHR